MSAPLTKPGENYLLSAIDVAEKLDPYIKDKDAYYDWIRVAFAESVDIHTGYRSSRTGYVPVVGGFKCCDAYCISGPNPDGTYDYGLMQINSLWINSAPGAKTVMTNPRTTGATGSICVADVFDPVQSIRFAVAVIAARSSGRLTPWSSFNSGAYLDYYKEAADGIYGWSLIKRGRELAAFAAKAKK